MPWKDVDIEQAAQNAGINTAEVRAKQQLMALIAEARKAAGITQTELGRRVGVSQGRIAQIESGIGTSKVTFDVLFHLLTALGKECRVVVHAGGTKARKHKPGYSRAAR
ncbi:MAG: helix-turn-helix transcriptional regulator [Nitrospinae bacterium]|nr:helix-turn-helix transcriptional regulator [Nitrospinota bacterium]